MAIGLNQIYTSGTGLTGASSYTSGSFTPTSNSLLVVSVQRYADNASTTTTNVTISGGGLTWTRQTGLRVASGTEESCLHVFTAPVVTGASMTVTVSGYASDAGVAFACIHAYSVTGYNTGTPTGATATGTNTASGAISITLSGTPASTSLIFASDAWVPNGSGGATTAGSGWTGLYNDHTGGFLDLQDQQITGSTSTNVPWVAQCATDSVYNSMALQFAIEILAASSGPTTPADCSFLFQRSENLKHPATLDTNQPRDNMFMGWGNPTPSPLAFWFQPPFLGPVPKSTQNTNQSFVFAPPAGVVTPGSYWLEPTPDLQRHVPTIYTAQSFVCNPTIGPPVPGWYTQAPDLLNHPHSLDTNQPLNDTFAGWTNNNPTPTAFGFWQQPNDLLRHPATLDTNQRFVPAPSQTQFIFTTTGAGTWIVPSGVTSIQIEGIGGGADGSAANETGGGGGAYAKSVSIAVTPGQTVYLNIGSRGANGSDTWANVSVNSAPGSASNGIVAKAGQGGATPSGGSGASSVGTLTYSGGNGGLLGSFGAAGGGGAAGPNGIGAQGATGGSNSGGGGGGADGGLPGSAGSGSTPGSGGNGFGGTGGGTSGGNATPGSGGGGSGANPSSTGGSGASDNCFDATHGAGGGGGGGSQGGLAGGYGGGGGGSFGSTAGQGTSGIVVITLISAATTPSDCSFLFQPSALLNHAELSTPINQRTISSLVGRKTLRPLH